MKNNLVKILGTFGLIIAIALILKGVFGVGKVTTKKFSKPSISSSKNLAIKETIIFDKCWGPDDFANYEDGFRDSDFEKMLYQINLVSKEVTRTLVFKDTYLKKMKDWDGTVIPKVTLDNFYIKSSTDTYVETKKFDEGGWLIYYLVFNLKNGQITVNTLKPRPDTTNWQCNKFK